MRRYEVFVIAVLANLIGAYLYDALKRKANANRL